jgi:hypothetical protein
MELSDFLTYCLARYGMGVDPRTCKDEAFLRSLVRFSIEKALASGRLNEEGKRLAREYLRDFQRGS